MIRLSWALGGAIVTIALTHPADAADLPIQVPTPVVAIANWTGIYIGGSVAGRWTDATWATTAIGSPPGPVDPTTTPASFNSPSVRAGGYIGYNWQFDPLYVVGLEADVAWGNNNLTLGGIPGTFGTGGQGAGLAAISIDSSNVRLGWEGGFRGRFGMLFTPTWLLYGTGGLAWQQVDFNATCNGTPSNGSWCVAPRDQTISLTRVGWTLGGGIETMLWNHWLIRAEYRYSDYGTFSRNFFANAPIDQVTMTGSLKTNIGLIGAAYKF